jgi:hypothetical protein
MKVSLRASAASLCRWSLTCLVNVTSMGKLAFIVESWTINQALPGVCTERELTEYFLELTTIVSHRQRLVDP